MKKKTFFWRIFSAFLGILAFLLILELLIRAGGAVSSYLQERSNSAGLSKKASYRIMCLGESTTAGQYPSFLKNILNRNNVGLSFDVIDKGVTMTNTHAILLGLEKNLDMYKPDIVVTMMGHNDEGIVYYKDIPEADSGIFKHVRVYRFLRLIGMNFFKKTERSEFFKLDSNPSERVVYENNRNKSNINWMFPSNFVDRILKFDKGRDNGHGRAGWGYLAQGDYLKAEGSFKRSLEADPNSEISYFGLGCFFMIQHDFKEAEAFFKKALVINSGLIRACIGLAKIRISKGLLEEAEYLLKAVNADNPIIYSLLGYVYLKEGRHDEAREFFKKELSINPKSIEARKYLGELYWAYSDILNAESMYREILEIDDKNVFAMVRLGSIYNQDGRLKEAEELFKKAARIDPRVENAKLILAGFYRVQKRYQEAKATYEEALKFPGWREKVLESLEGLCSEMGLVELAEKYRMMKEGLGYKGENTVTKSNYLAIKHILDKRGIKLVAVQYPLCSPEPLRKMLEGENGVTFVDNKAIFEEAVENEGYGAYFVDAFAGIFGHCTDKGNLLLAKNIADVILEEMLHR